MMNLGLYIHIPFCVKKCNYCDFVSFSCTDYDLYFNSLFKEIDLYSDFLKKRNVDTIFIGGGTPSVVNHNYIMKILDKISFNKDCEVTIEVNPKTVTEEKLKAYKESGINRISIGMQSANDNELKILGRVHNYYDFLKSYEMIINSGFDNINVDTMFGIPEQTLDSFKYTLDCVKKINPTHISSYSLIIEENTPFYNMELNLPSEEVEREMFECIKDELAGFERYEISNYSKPGYECKHNIKYWQMQDYLGIGLNSHSFITNKRFYNYDNMNRYVSALEKGQLPVKEETTEDNYEMLKDAVITGLRMCKGINLDMLKARYGINLLRTKEKKITEYVNYGFMNLVNNNLSFTEKGFSVSNHILSELI